MPFSSSSAPAPIRSLCVYCGSRPGHDPAFAQMAAALGRHLAEDGIRLIYGGGAVGLMGIVARAVMESGGEAIGIIPYFLDELEVAQTGLSELILVDTMHERKALMADMADAFVILPGGAGTLDEMIEITTWAQLGLHEKPILLLNQNGYWEPFLALMRHVVEQGFAAPRTLELFSHASDLDVLMGWLRRPEAPRAAADGIGPTLGDPR